MQLVHHGHHLGAFLSLNLGVGVQSVLDLVHIVIGQASEANSVVAEWDWVAFIELASKDSGKVHTSCRNTADNNGWTYF